MTPPQLAAPASSAVWEDISLSRRFLTYTLHMLTNKTKSTTNPSNSEFELRHGSAALGLLILASMALLSFVFSAGTSLQYAAGYTAGKLVVSIGFALPLYVAIRYATRCGRRLAGARARARAVNLFCFIVTGIWIAQILLALVVPGAIRDLVERQKISESALGVHRELRLDDSPDRSAAAASAAQMQSAEMKAGGASQAQEQPDKSGAALLVKIRKEYPALLADLSDEDAVRVIHRTFYSDLPISMVASKLGLKISE